MSDPLEKFNSVSLLFPSNYLAGDDLKGKDVTVTIEDIDPRHKLKRENKQVDAKPVVKMTGKKKLWVLNKTNAKIIARLYGPEVKNWRGKQVTLYATPVEAFGEVHNAIRVRPYKPKE